ncbi:MAG TPA: serine/threonine-protein kinase, partial [Pyrinomonadaceae bacterium]|nr:serine/threonine-protein kinase [Pyrinomonadaceae bacterium]
MSPDDYQKVKEIFQSVLDLNEEERRSVLDEWRSTDPAIVREVERLLNSYQPSYLEQPAVNLLEHTGGALKSGQEIGQFTIIEKIGAGGMGEVYLAEDRKLGRHVAVKLLPDLFTNDEERLRRFQQEARTASALNHPNILTIYDIGESGKRHYIATEFIDGETLRGRLNRGRQSVADALEIAIQAASALQAAHEAGIIHRDIKPENIMLRRDGLVKILDFGLAKLDDTKDRSVSHEAPTEHYVRTIPGVIMGTVQYMSPEQARGQSTDARTDIWSLGCVIYEMLTGKAPFRGDSTADQIAEIVKSNPAPITANIADVPDRLEEIVAKSIEKDPDERYQTVKDLLIDLKRLNRSLDIESELMRSNPDGVKAAAPETNGNTPHPPEKTSSVEYLVVGMKLHKRTAIGIIAGLVALVGGTAYVARNYWLNSNDARFEYAKKMKLAVRALEASNLTYVRQLLDETTPKPGEQDLTGFEWGYLSQQYAERSAFQPLKLQDQGWVDALAFSPDGSTVATAGGRENENTIRLWDVATGNEIKKFTGHTRLITSVAFSPDGTKLLTGGFDKTARVWDIESTRQIAIVQGAIGSLSFIQNGKKFVGVEIVGLDASVKVWDAVTGAEIPGQINPPNIGQPLAVSPDGKLFAGQDSSKLAVVWESSTGRVLQKLGAKSGLLNDLKFSPNSKLLLAGTDNGVAKMWDVRTAREIR